MSDRLKNFPISFFAVAMGLTGATIAWQRMETIWRWNTLTGSTLFWLSSLIFIFIYIFIVYLRKSFQYHAEIKKEFKNIPKLSFFPTITISLLLLSIASINSYASFSRAPWILGTIGHFFSVWRSFRSGSGIHLWKSIISAPLGLSPSWAIFSCLSPDWPTRRRKYIGSFSASGWFSGSLFSLFFYAG